MISQTKRLISPFVYYKDLIAVTSKTAHNITLSGGLWCDAVEENTGAYYKKGGPLKYDRNEFHCRLTVNRGPLIINTTRYIELGKFDLTYPSIHDCDDHDLMIRYTRKINTRNFF